MSEQIKEYFVNQIKNGKNFNDDQYKTLLSQNIRVVTQTQNSEVSYQMDDQVQEYDLFKILLLSVILQSSKAQAEKLMSKDPFDLYMIAKGHLADENGNLQQPIEFHHFHKYIRAQIGI